MEGAMKVSELSGALLDYWVARAGEEWKRAHELFPTMTRDTTFNGVELRDYPRGEYGTLIQTCVLIPSNPFRQDNKPFCPSTAWVHGGPIIEREGISLHGPIAKDFGDDPHVVADDREWVARTPLRRVRHDKDAPCWGASGETPLIAAMRAYVHSVFGNEVPDEPS
jgi:hypothetical protein